MVLPSLLLPFLSTVNNTSPLENNHLGCYSQNPPNETQIGIITYKECKAAIVNVPLGDKSLAPLTFSRKEDAGFTTPYVWTHGVCEIAIDVVGPDVVETTTFAAIFKRGFDLMVECVIKPPHFGGIGLVGEDLDLMVTVRHQ